MLPKRNAERISSIHVQGNKNLPFSENSSPTPGQHSGAVRSGHGELVLASQTAGQELRRGGQTVDTAGGGQPTGSSTETGPACRGQERRDTSTKACAAWRGKPPRAAELSPALCPPRGAMWRLGAAHKGGDMRILRAGSGCCVAKTNTTWKSSYLPIKNSKNSGCVLPYPC